MGFLVGAFEAQVDFGLRLFSVLGASWLLRLVRAIIVLVLRVR